MSPVVPAEGAGGGRPQGTDGADGGPDEQAETEQATDPAPAEAEGTPGSGSSGGGGALDRFLGGLATVAEGVLSQPGFPISLLLVVVMFLVAQNRIDRRDPKLAMAPVYPDPHLDFEPVSPRALHHEPPATEEKSDQA